MPAPQSQTRTIDDVLTRLGAKLATWEVHALFLGAQTSTNVRLGPHHLFEHILGAEPVFGDSIEEANANLQVFVALWNRLVDEHRRDRVRLSTLPPSEEPEISQLVALAERRAQELIWFTRGIDAGGDDPIEFGPEGERILRGLAEAGAFCQAYQELLARQSDATPSDIAKTRESLEMMTETLERMIADLMTISDGVRRRAIDEFTAREGTRTDDGVPIRRAIKVGRNEPCPCGSGRKWKRCCGSPEHMQ